MPGELAGKVGIVTGGSRGIGRAIAIALARHGATLLLIGRDQAMLAESAALVDAAGGNGVTHAADLSDPAAPAAATARVEREFGRLDLVIGNAGTTRIGAFPDQPWALWEDGFEIKFFAHVRLAKAAWPMLVARRGKWLSISGAKARTPTADATIGASVNQAYMAFTKALADMGLKDGVQVNCINPGGVNTGRLDQRLAGIMARTGMDRAAARAEYERLHGRVMEPEDVANLAAFVLTTQGRYFHGAALDLDAGTTPGLV